jgi:nucleotide-binding universal stress UspA family protein
MRVLVAYDGSAAAAQACRLVGGSEWPAGSEVRVVTAFHPFVPGTLWPVGIIDATTAQTIFDEDREAARQTAEKGAASIHAPSARVTCETVEGRSATAILGVARSFAPDLMVVGTRGLGPFRSTLLGSVSEELVDRGRWPILVARGDAVRRVMLAYDDSPAARAATSLMAAWPMFKGVQMRIVTIAPNRDRRQVDRDPSEAPSLGKQLDMTEKLLASAREVAARATGLLNAVRIEADVDVRVDHAAHGIVAAAQEWHADLIMMGHSGHGLLEELLLGSVARGVLHHAQCSVLVAHPPKTL